jgi:hypothetical protein
MVELKRERRMRRGRGDEAVRAEGWECFEWV